MSRTEKINLYRGLFFSLLFGKTYRKKELGFPF